LRPWIVGVTVVIEEVRQRETTGGDGVPVHRALTGQLIFLALDGLFFAAESEVMRDVEASQGRLRRG